MSDWQKVEEIFDQTVEMSPAEQKDFLDRVCAGDHALRREVEDLLAADAKSDDFIESPLLGTDTLANFLPDKFEDSHPPQILGRRVGAYELVRELGRGGMGAVYLARRADSEFKKQVAVKLIKRGMDTDFILKRFRNERQILAHLDHPNIARLLDGGTTGEGLPYFVMEYVEGLPVNQYCDVHKLASGERLRLFQAICAAVGYAHRNSIIHRDLKPGNILVTKDGTPKLLDFGIAKILNQKMGDTFAPTLTGMRLMTPEYASPEQIRGETLTTASDIYSLGVLLFEILSGARPYKFPSRAPHEIARVICEDEPLRLTEIEHSDRPVKSFLPDKDNCQDLENIIAKALQKSPAQRYDSAAAFSQDIQKYLNGALVFAPDAAHDTDDRFENSFAAGESLAVLPFRSLQYRKADDSGDYLALGLTDSLITRLSRLKTISVRPTSSILRYSNHDSLQPNEAGRELRVTHILDGRLQQVGNRVRLTAQLVKINNNETVWAGQFDEENEDILILQDSISGQVARALVKELTGEEREQIERRGTDNPKAYDAYLRGRVHWHSYTVEGLAKALVAFYEAIALDPNFALPYSGVADYYNFLSVFGVMSPGESFPAAKEAAQKAIALDANLAEAYTSLGIVALGYDWDFAEAERLFKKALELNPNYAEGRVWYSHFFGATAQHDQAVKQMRRAENLNPQSVSLFTAFALCLRNAGRFAEGLEKLRRALVLQPGNPTALAGYSWFVRDLEIGAEAEAACRQAVENTRRQNLPLYAYGYTLAVLGRADEARRIAEELKARKAHQYVPPIYVALIYAALDEPDAAFEWLTRSFAERDFWAIWLPIDPRLNALRDDARYAELAKQIAPVHQEAAIHQSHIATKLLPAVEKPETSEQAKPSTVQMPVKKRRASFYAAIAAAVGILFAGVVFLGMRDGWIKVEYSGQNPSAVTPLAPAANPSAPKSIAVLPFTPNEPGAEVEETLSVSLAQVLASKLGQIRQLSVLPVALGKNRGRSIADSLAIGRELSATYILRGILQRNGGNVQINAALVNVGDGKVLWVERFDEPLADLPSLQNTISERVLDALTVEISAAERQQIEKIYTTNGEAYQLYLAGRYQMTNRTAENLRQAIKTFSLARDKDPNFALAYAGLADAYSLLALYEMPAPPDAYDNAKENALKALTIDDSLAETRASLAYILFNYDRNVVSAEKNYRRAIELNPSYPRAFHWYALMLSAIGRHDEAIANIKTAQRLEPRSAIVRAAIAQVYFYAKNYEAAVNAAQESLEINEGFIPAYRSLRMIYQATGDYEKSLATYQKERIYSNDTDEKNPNWLMITAQVEAVGGKRAEALKNLNAALAAPSVKNNPNTYSYEFAVAYALLGDRENARKWLAIADKSRAHNFSFAQVDARFDKIRD